MGWLRLFKKKSNVPERPEKGTTNNAKNENVQIEFEGGVVAKLIDKNGEIQNEREEIIKGAMTLMETNPCKVRNLEDAIITAATMFRGLGYVKTIISDDGRKTVILRETAQGGTAHSSKSKDKGEIDDL